MARTEDPIWYLDPLVLVREDRITHILPRPNTPLASQLNADMRFALVYGITLAIFQRPESGVYVPLIVAAITAGVYSTDKATNNKLEERMRGLGLQPDPVTSGLRVRPTQDNPYMNVLVSDYARFPNRPPAADMGVPGVTQRAEACYEHDLYRDASDVFNRNSSSRQSYTTPATTIPNDQGGFAR